MSTFAEVKRDWKKFKHDHPGERFQHQHERLQKKPRGLRIAMAVLGVLLLAGGIVLLFVPGPGLLLVVFGLALLAGLSGALARALDRAEPPLRHEAELMRRGWDRLSRGAQVGVGALGASGVAAIGIGVYRMIT